MTVIDDSTRKSLVERATRRCECHNSKCRQHRSGTRCPRGLRGEDWYIVMREPNAGDKLWNLLAMCPDCFVTYGKKAR